MQTTKKVQDLHTGNWLKGLHAGGGKATCKRQQRKRSIVIASTMYLGGYPFPPVDTAAGVPARFTRRGGRRRKRCVQHAWAILRRKICIGFFPSASIGSCRSWISRSTRRVGKDCGNRRSLLKKHVSLDSSVSMR